MNQPIRFRSSGEARRFADFQKATAKDKAEKKKTLDARFADKTGPGREFLKDRAKGKNQRFTIEDYNRHFFKDGFQ